MRGSRRNGGRNDGVAAHTEVNSGIHSTERLEQRTIDHPITSQSPRRPKEEM
jgi:hypothetical protein